jgi:predicted transcriptional regulator
MDIGPSSITLETTGEDALESALELLEMIQSQEQGFERVYIEIESDYEKQSEKGAEKRRQATYQEFGSDGSDQEEYLGVREGTSHSKMLKGLYRLDEEGPVTTKRVIRETDLPEGTGYAAMSDLHDRGLVNRREGNSRSYRYEISESGKEEIKRLGIFGNNGK